jgi:hypothetical protein
VVLWSLFFGKSDKTASCGMPTPPSCLLIELSNHLVLVLLVWFLWLCWWWWILPCCSTHEQGGLCGGVAGVMVVLLVGWCFLADQIHTQWHIYTNSGSYLMYGVTQFCWSPHTMILWCQMDAMRFLLFFWGFWGSFYSILMSTTSWHLKWWLLF